jgi:hypothetical protein
MPTDIDEPSCQTLSGYEGFRYAANGSNACVPRRRDRGQGKQRLKNSA